MSRYVDADALKAFIRNQYFQCDMPEEWGNGVMWATSQINHYCNKVAPSIDIEPERGEWIYGTDEDGNEDAYPWTCSICKQKYPWQPNFCPNCGAKMVNGEGGE